MTTGSAQMTAANFRSGINPDWCPGCGDFGVLNSLQRACAELGLQPHQILTVSGIGLLLQPAGLHQRLRRAHAPRALASRGHGRKARQP